MLPSVPDGADQALNGRQATRAALANRGTNRIDGSPNVDTEAAQPSSRQRRRRMAMAIITAPATMPIHIDGEAKLE